MSKRRNLILFGTMEAALVLTLVWSCAPSDSATSATKPTAPPQETQTCWLSKVM